MQVKQELSISRLWPAGVFAVLALIILRGITDPDIWTHLTIGREVLRLGHVPPTEFYVAPLAGQAGHFNEWGYGVMLYLAHEAGGLGALAFLNAAVGAAIFTFLFDILRRRLDDDRWLALALTLFAVWMAEFRLNFRPEMMSYLALVASVWGMERYRADPRPRWLAPMMTSGLILPYFHPSILLSLLAVGAYSLDLLIRAERRPHFRPVLGAAAATAVLATFNPYGFEQVYLPVTFALDAPLMSGITELLPALQTEVGPRFLIAAALALTGLGLLAWRRAILIGDVLMAAIFGWIAFRHARNVGLFGMVALLPFAGGIALLQLAILRRWAGAVAAGTALAVGAHALAQPRWGVGLDTATTPVKAGELLSGIPLSGPILAFFHLGNYMAWTQYPRVQVIADARHFGFDEALRLHDDLFSVSQNAGWHLRRAGISAVVTPMTLAYSGDFIPLAAALLKSDEWVLALVEDAGVVFLPRANYSGPALPASAAWDRAVAELTRNLKEYPDSASSRRNLAVARAARGMQ